MENKLTFIVGPEIGIVDILKKIGVVVVPIRHINGARLFGKVFRTDRTLSFDIRVSQLYPKCVYLEVIRTDAESKRNKSDSPLGYIRTSKVDIILGRNGLNTTCYNTTKIKDPKKDCENFC